MITSPLQLPKLVVVCKEGVPEACMLGGLRASERLALSLAYGSRQFT